MRKEELYKTCKHRGEYVAILAWYADGPTGAMYKIRRISGEVELVHSSECSEFCL